MTTTSPAHTLGPRAELDYYDVRALALPMPITALQAWNLVTAEPQPLLQVAFGIRDTISALFGVKRIGGFSGTQRDTIKPGDRLDFFLVEHCASDMLVLTERDRHLDVMICIAIAEQVLTITSSVITHNAFGRLYMLPVGPAHKVIINSDFKRLKRRLDAMATGSATLPPAGDR
ncbi:DUF2867 domain-containing protein [Devosia sp. FKR38]|uniref:DUF2867 domain-containing protein n=1 Tax=Devosia sp. FKR38 TaxID=2562312 RepID=UPI0010C0BB81|nr:DUF2867 domain-containing protein [Devosia sp. FKR38]